ncbi:MAG: transcription antitermination factor NusB [Thermoguttaceae bacterium]|nr:transcription antitermination factor NusB [Thermoguttaceae bacterium]
MCKKLTQNQLRSIGRAYALQALYQAELNPQATAPSWDGEFDDEEGFPSLAGKERAVATDFARLLFEGVVDRKSAVDALLNAAFDKGRTIERTSPVDRCILRLAAYEMHFIKTPKAVVISQAIELGVKYGDTKTHAFLNGVLDQIDKTPESSENSDQFSTNE